MNTYFRTATSAKEWLKTSIADEGSFLTKIIFKILLQFIETIEDILGKTFYIDHAISNIGRFKVSGRILEFAQEVVKLKFLNHYYFGDHLPDEPRAFIVCGGFGDLINSSDAGFSKNLATSGVTGVDFFDPNKAMIRCLGEAIERTCQSSYSERRFTFDSFENLNKNAISPNDFVAFSSNQMVGKKFSMFRVSSKSRIGWIKGNSLIHGGEILAPSQLVYLTYRKNHKKEPSIRLSISTGAAAHTDKEEALYKGVCEVVERDAFMIHYLNKLSPPILDLENAPDDDIKKIWKMFRRYNLELYVLDMTTDIPIPTFSTLIIDRTEIGPAVVISNKTGFDMKQVILGSIAEATKSWRARRRRLGGKPNLKPIKNKAEEISDLKERALFWSNTDMIEHISFLTRGRKKNVILESAPESSHERLDKSVAYFKKNNFEVAAVDIAIKEAKDLGFYVYMILIPKLQPLYLNEKYRNLGGDRLYRVPISLGYFKEPKKEEELNNIIHPFV